MAEFGNVEGTEGMVAYGSVRPSAGTRPIASGRATLAAGTVVVPTALVTATCNIFLSTQTPGGTPSFLRVSARSNGVSFTITSGNAADTSVVGWLIVEPT